MEALDRPPAYQPKTGKCRALRNQHQGAHRQGTRVLNLELNDEDVAVFKYKPRKCRRAYHVVALRKNISRTNGEQALIDEIRYFFYITTNTDKTPAQIVELAATHPSKRSSRI